MTDLRNPQRTVAAELAAIERLRRATDADLSTIERPNFFTELLRCESK